MRNDDSKERREKAVAQVELLRLKEAQTWKKTFGTEEGQKCLSLLKKHYYDIEHMAHNDPTVTQNRAAQRDLVRYIMSQVEYEA